MKAFKKAIEVKFSIYDKDGTEETKEGPVEYFKGEYRMVGVQGEVWPMKPSAFEKNYKVTAEGIGTKKKVIVDVEFATKIQYVDTSWGQTLKAKEGDAIISASSTDRWVVDKSIFDETYEIVKEEA